MRSIYIIVQGATNLENLEYSGISLNMENSGIRREIVTNKVFLGRHSNICVKQLLTG